MDFSGADGLRRSYSKVLTTKKFLRSLPPSSNCYFRKEDGKKDEKTDSRIISLFLILCIPVHILVLHRNHSYRVIIDLRKKGVRKSDR